MQIDELVSYLDSYLDIDRVPDYKDAYNGLQVEGRAEVRHVAVAVDACLATIESAVGSGADMMIVHHGLFWGRKAPITGTVYRRLAALIKNDISLYACHLPLDAHPEVGNNHVLARRLGLTVGGLWGDHDGVPIGVYAETDQPRAAFVESVRAALAVDPLVIATGPSTVRKVGIV